MSAAIRPQRVMLLWCPDWPITAAIRTGALPAHGPTALVESGRVFACSAAARAEGVRRGLRLREAQARCPGLVVQPYRAIEDARTFEPVLQAIESVMPGVQPLRPGVCAIRARGPAAYYGGEEEAALWLLDRLDRMGLDRMGLDQMGLDRMGAGGVGLGGVGLGGTGLGASRIGVADGVFTAEQAARQPQPQRIRIVPEGLAADFLAPQPIGVLDDLALVSLLRRLGAYTLGEFAALKPSDVLGRFGEQGARLHALAGGLDSRPVQARVPPPELDCSVDFEPAVDRIDQVAFGVRAMADTFIRQLGAARLVCTAVRVELGSERGELSERTWLHPRSFTANEVVDRVRWQLQGGVSEVALSSGIVRVRLLPESVDSIGNHEEGLWGTGPTERIHHALSRVQGMLGRTAVLTASISGGRGPSDRTLLVPWGDRMLHARPPEPPWPGRLPDPAPATVFEPPRAVTVFSADGTEVSVSDRGALSGPPTTVSAGSSTLRVAAWAGPWTVDERWWDAAAASRASRFQLVDSTGMAWLLVLQHGSWWAEARYD